MRVAARSGDLPANRSAFMLCDRNGISGGVASICNSRSPPADERWRAGDECLANRCTKPGARGMNTEPGFSGDSV